MNTKYSIGIDLGTTNTVMSYINNTIEGKLPQVFNITQIVAPGETAEMMELPSFIYLPKENEVSSEQLALPWKPEGADMVVGAYAREMTVKTPDEVVASSKSWLCSQQIDRHSSCLPAGADEEEGDRMMSPVMAATIILNHLKENWNYVMAKENEEDRMENQDVIITVPASFDAVARELTMEAATAAGLRFTLLEEPQAAFYAWLANQGENWRKVISAGDVVLVCDIGGGTTDFSLIAVVNDGGDMSLQRLAVGDHTLLGGDNMDMTLALTVAARLKKDKNIQLNRRQMASLTHACRQAKEKLGSGNVKDQPLTILGTGTGLVAGTIKTKISYEELKEAILDGFFPKCAITDKPLENKLGGIREMALDYTADPAFTRHLAKFLDTHSFKDGDGNPILPNTILFNGGVTDSELFTQRIIEVIDGWKGEGYADTMILQQPSGNLSVAIGAAWYAHVKQAGGIRIRAGAPRSYYVGIESPMPAVPGMTPPVDALCVVNFGMEEGTSAQIKVKGLGLLVGEATDFRFFTSTTRHEDAIGDRIDANGSDDLTEIAPLRITLQYPDGDEANGNLVPVKLRSELTEIGTLQLWCDETKGSNSWKLEFSIRGDE